MALWVPEAPEDTVDTRIPANVHQIPFTEETFNTVKESATAGFGLVTKAAAHLEARAADEKLVGLPLISALLPKGTTPQINPPADNPILTEDEANAIDPPREIDGKTYGGYKGPTHNSIVQENKNDHESLEYQSWFSSQENPSHASQALQGLIGIGASAVNPIFWLAGAPLEAAGVAASIAERFGLKGFQAAIVHGATAMPVFNAVQDIDSAVHKDPYSLWNIPEGIPEGAVFGVLAHGAKLGINKIRNSSVPHLKSKFAKDAGIDKPEKREEEHESQREMSPEAHDNIVVSAVSQLEKGKKADVGTLLRDAYADKWNEDFGEKARTDPKGFAEDTNELQSRLDEAQSKLDLINNNLEKNVINDLNPTGGLFADYTPEKRMKAKLADNITTLDKTSNKSPNDIITVYRGAPENQKGINEGDFITTDEELAKSYSGNKNVLSKKVKMSDVLDDMNEPLGGEYIYRPESSEYTDLLLDKESLSMAVSDMQDMVNRRLNPIVKPDMKEWADYSKKANSESSYAEAPKEPVKPFPAPEEKEQLIDDADATGINSKKTAANIALKDKRIAEAGKIYDDIISNEKGKDGAPDVSDIEAQHDAKLKDLKEVEQCAGRE
jgi:hypothetical protein